MVGMDRETEVIVEASFESAARATRERMARLTPEERLNIQHQLLRMIYPHGLDERIQETFEVIQRRPTCLKTKSTSS